MKRVLGLLAVVSLILTFAGSVRAGSNPNAGLLWEYVGQVTNSGTDSAQYGNLVNVAGATGGTYFTFYTSATTTSVIANGPLKIIHRTGTMTIYEGSAAGVFANPDSFRSGTEVLTADLDQQVVVNTATGSFSVINLNRVTSASPLSGGDAGQMMSLSGQTIRTVLNGQLNTVGAPPPSGWFGGYATK
jgi:hypothetical protein